MKLEETQRECEKKNRNREKIKELHLESCERKCSHLSVLRILREEKGLGKKVEYARKLMCLSPQGSKNSHPS